MDIPYYTIPFKLSQESLDWLKTITDPLVQEFQEKGVGQSGLLYDPLTPQQKLEWLSSDAWQEINKHFEPLKLVPDTSRIQFFVYKSMEARKDIRGNPHIDTYAGIDEIVPARFNILLNGDDDQEMVWWDTIVPWQNEPKIHIVQFPRPEYPDGKLSPRAQAKGENAQERWATMGEPVYRYNQLTKFNEYASFVRTDKLHALNWTAKNPRLILSIRFLQEWSIIKQQCEH
jgi:hypothetical protein